MKNIFEIEKRLDIQAEFNKFISGFHKIKSVPGEYLGNNYSLFGYFDIFVFRKWKFRDTMITTDEFLEHIGISKPILSGREQINEETFLRYIEFVLNMIEESGYSLLNRIRGTLLESIIENIHIILEKLNYKSEKLEDRIILMPKNADVDSVISAVPQNISYLILEYNDFRIKDDLEEKKKILKQIDLYIEENINLKSLDNELNNAIGTIVNEMGINHPIKKEQYKSFTKKQLLEWYDKCFLMMLHSIRLIEINNIKNERKALSNSNK